MINNKLKILSTNDNKLTLTMICLCCNPLSIYLPNN